MAGMMLRCSCWITEEGEYMVGQGCKNCKECNAVSAMHPFGDGRIAELKMK